MKNAIPDLVFGMAFLFMLCYLVTVLQCYIVTTLLHYVILNEVKDLENISVDEYEILHYTSFRSE